ncbi:hypothetical protein ABPG73_011792 [Tetrahymena malaccensis]
MNLTRFDIFSSNFLFNLGKNDRRQGTSIGFILTLTTIIISDHIFIPSIMAKSKEQVDNKNSLIQSELNSINLEEQEKESNKEETPKSIFYTKKSTLNINSEKEQNIQQSSWLQKSGQNQNKKQAFGKAQNKTLKLQKQSSKKMEFSMTFSQIIQTDNPFITNQCNNDKTLQNSQLFQQKQVSPQQYQTERLKKFQDQNVLMKIRQILFDQKLRCGGCSPDSSREKEKKNYIFQKQQQGSYFENQIEISKSLELQSQYIQNFISRCQSCNDLSDITYAKNYQNIQIQCLNSFSEQEKSNYNRIHINFSNCYSKQINDTEQNKAKQVSDQLISPLIKAQSQEQIDKKSFLFINQINFSNSQDEQKDQNKDESPKSIFYTKQNTQNSDFIKEENILQNSQKRRQIHQLKKYELAKNKSQGIENENIQQKKKEIATTFSSVIKTETPLITNQSNNQLKTDNSQLFIEKKLSCQQYQAERFKAFQDQKNIIQVRKILFDRKLCCQGSKSQNEIQNQIKSQIEQQVNKSLNIFEFYKDLLFLKKAMMILLSQEQLATINILGCSPLTNSQKQDFEKKNDELQKKQKEEESYLQKQLEIFSSFELQSQKIQSYISRCSNSDNLCEIDQRILSSIFKI